jgi:hypothetical protein
MSDMGDDFNALRKMKQEKRADNREASAAILSRAGIVFESKNNDAHLIVLAGAMVVDFWPGTGKWIVRGGSSMPHRGVRKLVEYVEKQRTVKP